MKPEFMSAPDGQRVRVIRPKHPHVMVELERAATKRRDFGLLSQAIFYCVEYGSFIGFAAKLSGRVVIVDKDGALIDDPRNGDAFVADYDPSSN